MSTGSPEPGEASAAPGSRRLLVAVLALTLVAHVRLLFKLNVNWDEFYFLAFVYDYARGTLVTPLQTFHVHFFGWLLSVEGSEVDQVIAARAALFLLLAGTCVCVYQLARRVASANAALFAVICCAAYSNVLYHGSSFRSDGLAAFLLMGALVLAQARTLRLPSLAVAAVFVSLALLVTIKSVFYLPTIGLVIAAGPWREWHGGRRLMEVLIFAVIVGGVTLALYHWHVGTMAVEAGQRSVPQYLESSASKVIRRNAFVPQLGNFKETLRGNLIQWGALVFATALLWRRLVARQQMVQSCWTLALVLPLFSVVFYRNAFPYFYVFLMPPALVLCAVAFDAFSEARAFRSYRVDVARLATLALGLAPLVYAPPRLSDGTAVQRDVIGAVHQIFPEPVSYVDRNSMIASFPKVGFFMSGWGLENYRAAGRPIFADLLRTRRPRFLIANSPALLLPFVTGKGGGLFEEDITALRDNFVPYWGPIFVLGKQIRLEGGADATCEVIVAGPYMLQSEGPVWIDGSAYAPGLTVVLQSGAVALRSHHAQNVILRTSDAGPVPPRPPPQDQLYTTFPRNGPRVSAFRG